MKSNTTREAQTGLDLNVNARASSLNVPVRADCGQLAVRKDEPGTADRLCLRFRVGRGPSAVSRYFIGDCSRSWIEQMISVVQEAPQRRTKRAGRVPLSPAE